MLKNKKKSNLISLVWIGFLFVALFSVVNLSKLDAGQLAVGFIVSLARILVAYFIALFLSLIIALLITTNEKVENAMLPVLDVFQSFPSFALFPAMVVAIHSSEVIIVSVLIITIIWPILFSIIGGIKNRREDLEEAATIYGAIGPKRLFHFTLPEIFPSIITGSIVGWGEGWEFIIGAELLVHTSLGIGNYLGELGNSQQNLLLAFGILVLMTLLFIINKLVWLPLLNNATKYQSE